MSPNPAENQPHHLRRMFTMWVIGSIVVDLLFWFLVGPHVPPGAMTQSASDNQEVFNVLFVIAFPVLLMVWIYLGYSAIVWRDKPGVPEPVGGAPARSNSSAQVLWITITSFIVVCLAIYGSVDLITHNGSGGGEGPSPAWAPAGAAEAARPNAVWTATDNNVLPVQVIAQQWKFTYRYPTFGGFESQKLIVPVNTQIAFHVTSLDVIHSFWAYQLSVKADANPQIDNVAFTETSHTGTFWVRCSELCGIWHGAMWNTGTVESKTAFESWATSTESAQSAATALLPPFAWTYVPDANGADGGYYPHNDGYSPSEVYGATKAAG